MDALPGYFYCSDAAYKDCIDPALQGGFQVEILIQTQEYERACAGYNTAAVIKMPLDISIPGRLISSTMSRALEMSRIVFSREPDHSYDELCEVPVKPFMKTSIQLPKLLWDVIGRIQWRFILKQQPERYHESRRRVYHFLDSLIEDGDDAIIVCHGWIIKLMIPGLLSAGLQGTEAFFNQKWVSVRIRKGKRAVTNHLH